MPDVPCGATVNPGFVHMPIAVIKLLANVERVALYWKVAVVEPVHAFVPLLPALTDPHEKMPRFDPPAVNVPPIVVSVTVTVLVVAVALMRLTGRASSDCRLQGSGHGRRAGAPSHRCRVVACARVRAVTAGARHAPREARTSLPYKTLLPESCYVVTVTVDPFARRFLAPR